MHLKRTGYIYPKIYSIDNIEKAIEMAAKGKRRQKRVREILDHKNEYAIEIHKMLRDKTYVPSPYIIKHIFDGSAMKSREIYKPRFFPDQIIHWALMLQIQPLIMNSMYAYNCGSVPGRGASHGQKAIRKWLDTDKKNTKYCLKMDVKKFYPSISNDIMKSMFRCKIKDKDCLWLIDKIVDSANGLPIGNFTSQWFANFYLQGLDHFIKQLPGCDYYVRYVDDLVILGPNKKALHKARKRISEHLGNIKLTMKNDWQVFKINDRPIDFLGFRFYRDCTTLRRRNALRIRRRIKKISKKSTLNYHDACAIVSYWGWLKRSDSYYFYNKYFKPYVSLRRARKVVSEHGKANNLLENNRF